MNRLAAFALGMRQQIAEICPIPTAKRSSTSGLRLLTGVVLACTLGVTAVHAQVVVTPSPLQASATSVNPVFNTGTAVLPVSSYSVAAVSGTKTTPSVTAISAYTGFNVVLSNPSNGETASGISFTATVTSLGNAGLATYSSAQAPANRTLTCTRGTGTSTTTVVTCTVSGTLATNQSLNFTLFFASPVKTTTGVVGTSCASTTDCLRLSGVARYNTIKQVSSNTVSVLLGSGSTDANRNKRAFTAAPTTGAKLYTGYDLNTIYGEFFSQVEIPNTNLGYTSASINELSFAANTLFPTTGGINCANFTTCWTTEITVPPPAGQTSFSPSYLTITLRADASFTPQATRNAILNAPTNYNVIPVYYYPNPASPVLSVIQACPATGGALTTGPCIASRQVITSTTMPATSGDIIWTIRNYNNGGYALR